MTKHSERKVEIAPSSETELRRREVQFLINVVEPDPAFQPFIVTDEASLLDAVGTDETEIMRRLESHFGAALNIDLCMPIWRLVDAIKRLRPGWPDESDPN
jgi:hypothetical protein